MKYFVLHPWRPAERRNVTIVNYAWDHIQPRPASQLLRMATAHHTLIKKGFKMLVTKNYNGSVTISDIKDNQYYNQTYYFYSLREAKKLFKQFLKGV